MIDTDLEDLIEVEVEVEVLAEVEVEVEIEALIEEYTVIITIQTIMLSITIEDMKKKKIEQ